MRHKPQLCQHNALNKKDEVGEKFHIWDVRFRGNGCYDLIYI